MEWRNELARYITKELRKDSEWRGIIEEVVTDSTRKIHLAIFNEPFLSLICSGEKTIESRFSVNKIAPYNKISKGDIVVMKASGGPVSGIFVVGAVHYFSDLTGTKRMEIEETYGKSIGTQYDPHFWAHRKSKKYATLIEIKKLTNIAPFRIKKNDRSAWSVLR